jgi:hypothetical protein
MNKALICISTLFVCLSTLFANTNVRHWNMTDGSRLYAELVAYDETASQIDSSRHPPIYTGFASRRETRRILPEQAWQW